MITVDDPDDMENHGKAVQLHAVDVESAGQQLAALLASCDDGLGHDALSAAIRDQLRNLDHLHASIAGSADGVHAIGGDIRAMAVGYREANKLSGR